MPVILLALAMLFGQEENPRARAASIYPHPKPPAHLVAYPLDVKIEFVKKHWLWTSHEPYLGKVQIQQARPKGGWYILHTTTTDANGRIAESVDVDSTWPQHLLFVLLDGRTEVGSVETDLGKQKVLSVEIQ